MRAKYAHPKTGRQREIDRIVEASSPIEAAAIREQLLELARSGGGGAPAERPKLADAVDSWLDALSGTIRESTRSRYRYECAAWVDVLGDYYVDAIEPEDVRQTLLGWRDAEVATETINGRLRTLRALAKHIGAEGVVRGVKTLQPTYDEHDRADRGKGLTLDELRALLRHGPTASDAPTWPAAWRLIALLVWTGLRYGEATALEWRDVDLELRTIRVCRAHYEGTMSAPKARGSWRTVPITSEITELLRVQRMEVPPDAVLVFPSKRSGGPVSKCYLHKSIRRACAAAGVDLAGRPAVHTFRHTMHQLLERSASDRVRHAIIGHTSDVETYHAGASVEDLHAALDGAVRCIEESER